MKTRNNVKPTELYQLQGKGEKISVLFYDLDSIVEVQGQDGIEYEYQMYTDEMVNNKEYIEANKEELFNLAKLKDYNSKADEVREIRRKLLEATDNYCLVDRVPSQEMIDYRQALRDITSQSDFPYEVEYPNKPKELL